MKIECASAVCDADFEIDAEDIDIEVQDDHLELFVTCPECGKMLYQDVKGNWKLV